MEEGDIHTTCQSSDWGIGYIKPVPACEGMQLHHSIRVADLGFRQMVGGLKPANPPVERDEGGRPVAFHSELRGEIKATSEKNFLSPFPQKAAQLCVARPLEFNLPRDVN
jgi:hypothetical protein